MKTKYFIFNETERDGVSIKQNIYYIVELRVFYTRDLRNRCLKKAKKKQSIIEKLSIVFCNEDVATNSITGPADPKDGSQSLSVYTSLSKGSPPSQTRIR